MFVFPKIKDRGFTLIEVLIATFLISIIFLGIFGGFQLAMRVVSQSRAETHALFLASQKIEEIRNLPYEQVESKQENIFSGGFDYNVQIIVENYDDCADGTVEGFDCDGEPVEPDLAPDDYKKVQITVSWEELWGGQKMLSTYVASGRLQTGEGMGALRTTISNSAGVPLEIDILDQFSPCPLSAIHIQNENTGLDQCYGTDPSSPGKRVLILEASPEPDDYKLIVQKQGYASAQTFRMGEEYNGSVIAVPNRKNPTINEGELYPLTFIIDKVSDLNILTAAPWGGGNFFDTFFNQEKVAQIENLEIEDKEVFLAVAGSGLYYQEGHLETQEIAPKKLTEWHQFSWNDWQETETDIFYQVLSATNSAWSLVPDTDLPGNSTGFYVSPLDLTGLDIEKYPKLKLRANFSTQNTTKTPLLFEWQVSWKDGEATPIGNVEFSLRGEKTVGIDAEEEPIYKYTDIVSSDDSGEKFLSGIEADNYHFFYFSKDGAPLQLNEELSPLPFELLPGASTEAILYLSSENSLLVQVEDTSSQEPVFGASVELANEAMGYYKAQNTNNQGETMFIPLEEGENYELTVKAENYLEKSVTLSVEGGTLKNVNLERYE